MQPRLLRGTRMRYDKRAAVAVAAAALLALAFVAAGCGQGAQSPASPLPRRNGEMLFSGVSLSRRDSLYLMRPNGTHQRPLIALPHPTGATWSPDGTRIAFSSARNDVEHCDLYVMNADGTQLRRLRHDGWCSEDPSWSPDGRRLAFSRRHNDWSSIWAMNLDGSDFRRLTHGDLDAHPTWSPDGTTIAFERQLHGIWLMETDGSKQRQLTTGETDAEPDWSPDGGWIAFSRTTEEYFPPGHANASAYVDIFVIHPDGSGLRRLTRRSGGNYTPAWSPDGTRIVFASDRWWDAHQDEHPCCRFGDPLMDIYMMDADGTQQKRLTRRPGYSYFPDWGPRQ